MSESDFSSSASQVKYCKLCLMPDSRPRIEFDREGICNACHNAEEKNKINWDKRRDEFLYLIEKFRSKDNHYDCVVPWSGGKDSSSIAHKLKFEFGLNPLLVTFSPLMPNEIGAYNREQILKLGFDHFMVRPSQKVSKYLARSFFINRGNPKIHWDAGVNSVPVQVAVNYKIPLIFYAEHGESEYGGRVLSEESKKIRDFTEVIENQVGDDPLNWADENIKEEELSPYLYPSVEDVEKVGVKALYFSYFFKWSMKENYEYIKDKIDFRTDEKGRTDGTFTDFDSLDDKIDNLYYYMQYIKFGFGRATRDSCRMIQNSQMDRNKALDLALKYDHEFPNSFHPEHLDYLDMDEINFTEIVDLHRNKEIWNFHGNQWNLRFPPK